MKNIQHMNDNKMSATSINIKNASQVDLLDLKRKHVLRCFIDYLYHKHCSDVIQEELNQVAEVLQGGRITSGIKVIQKGMRITSPWINEVLTREAELIVEQDKHLDAIQQIDLWLNSIDNDLHRDIIVAYLINNQCENAEGAARTCLTTAGNVCNVSKRIITRIAKQIM